MKNIFIGMLLVFLDFNIDMGSSRIGLLPDFAGYILMAKGLSELAGFSVRFISVSPFVKGMAVYSAICYVADLFGISAALGAPVNFALGLIATIVSLFISHGIIKGITDIETTREQNLNSGQLYFTWKLLAIFSLTGYIFYIIPAFMLICIAASFITGVFYLYMFHKTKNRFYEENPIA